MIIISNYREEGAFKDQFMLEVIREDKDNYYVRLLPQWQDEFQERDTIHPLRKCLVGDKDNLYSIYKQEVIEQLSLF